MSVIEMGASYAAHLNRYRDVRGIMRVMNVRWRSCIEMLFEDIVDKSTRTEKGAVDVDATLALLRNRRAFCELFRTRFYVGPVSPSEIDDRPTEIMIDYHRRQILKGREMEIRTKLNAMNSSARASEKLRARGGLGIVRARYRADRI